jgi:hypothetical protein
MVLQCLRSLFLTTGFLFWERLYIAGLGVEEVFSVATWFARTATLIAAVLRTHYL